MSISYITNLDKWVMLYGGDIHHALLGIFGGVNKPSQVARNPGFAIHARFATNPWGPWSAPVQVFGPGMDPQGSTLPPGTEYAPGGSMHHWLCPFTGSPCVAGEANPLYFFTNYGFLYAPSIVDAWTEARGQDADIYWTVSTWDPYTTLLLKTRINH